MQSQYNTFYVYVPTKLLHLVNASFFLLPIEDWDPLNLGYFLVPDFLGTLNKRPATRVGDIFPERSSVDHLAEVVEESVISSHQRHGQERDTGRTTELPDPTVDLDIYTLPDQVRNRILIFSTTKSFFTP